METVLNNIAHNFYVQGNLLKLLYKGVGNCKLCKYVIMHGNITSIIMGNFSRKTF